MKAKIKKSLVLSICMIVKNEEKHMKNCLEALVPLMKKVKSELIIADTGSTDKTVEIARQYTDKVFDYTYTGPFDFSAARNAAIERATGDWVLNVDADEYLADATGAILFLTSYEQNERFQMASCTIRNYVDERCRSYSDFIGVRMARREICHYTGTIHEVLTIVNPICNLDMVFNHHGYVYETLEAVEQKRLRNKEPMERELAQKPDDTRLMVLISDVCMPDEALPHLLRAVEIEREQKSSFMGPAFTHLISLYYEKGNYTKACEYIQEYFQLAPKARTLASAIDVYAILTQSKCRLQESLAAIESYEEYANMYNKYHAHEISRGDLVFAPVHFVTRERFDEISMRVVRCFIALERYDEAYKLLKTVNITTVPFFNLDLYLDVLYEYVTASNQNEKLIDCYKELLAFGDKDRASRCANKIEKRYFINKDSRASFVNMIAKNTTQQQQQNDDFLYLMVLISQKEDPSFPAKLSEYLSKPREWDAGYTEAINLALRCQCDISGVITCMDSEKTRALIYSLFQIYQDFVAVLLAHEHLAKYSETVCGLHWLVCAFETAVLNPIQVRKDERIHIINHYLDYLIVFVSNIYTAEVLNPDDIKILPPTHRFGCYMGMARLAEQEGDSIGFIHHVRSALKSCESMKDAVAVILADFEKRTGLSAAQKKS